MITLNFEPNLEHQTHAINAVVDLFNGQPTQVNGLNDSFILTQPNTDLITNIDSSQDNQNSARKSIDSQTIANQRIISDEQLLDNIQSIQKANGIEPSNLLFDEEVESKSVKSKQPIQYGLLKYGINASIEMETGTGKTYVYLRSIFELYQKYGMRKFVIVVPSVAIREGVLKSIEMTKTHFTSLYDNTPVNARVYDSKNLSILRDFATSNLLQILVINIDAFAKDENIINQVRERGIAPIEYIQACQPIVIVDEPQNMETDKRLNAIASLNPLITLRYSATHKYSRHLLYSLNPVKAYEAGLVKQIEVDSIMANDKFNEAYIELLEITPKKTKITAKINVYANVKGVVKKKTMSVSDNDDLYKKTEREIYSNGYVVTGINASEGYIEFANGSIVRAGQQLGGMNDSVMRYQIERTIEAHLDKQRQLLNKGIKVLSLLFIDRVDNYLVNTAQGYERSGKFALWFEALYRQVLDKPKYKELKQQLAGLYQGSISDIHNGYFSVDSKGRAKDTSGATQADDDTYSLIMKDKEKLLDLSNPLQFIFSHSALREGWDNPNVFQICTLNETKSGMKKRQEIGRGLRLCVGADGNRIYDKQVNVLTVIANESYEDFAKNLQNEIAEDYGIEFNGTKNMAQKREVKYRKDFMLDDDFKAIWDKIKQKTHYQVRFDSDALIDAVANQLQDMEAIQAPHVSAVKKRLIMSDEGIDSRMVSVNSQAEHYQIDADDTDNSHQSRTLWALPNVLTYLARHTKLTRQTLVKILAKSGRMADLFVNPQLFLDRAVQIIKQQQATLMVDGVEYRKSGQTYSQTLLANLVKQTTAVYASDYHFEVEAPNKTIIENLIPLDSNTEHQFAQDCESMPTVRFYFKLPNWFKIDTPVGTYNPDWAVVKEDEAGVSQLYFVAETKNTGGMSAGGHNVDISTLPLAQQQRIHCGQAHFKALDNEVQYKVVKTVAQL
ncbi:restriction endonuclease [Psychrobacter lutiphocae]|uniref:restriction endonuclease n=1 Tax=Psychrobacter lutiphocae TaxID=540500 RepID=UPI000363299D|nr:DEAD/DEAH box helicase family protein [Psychrobacter lutiphocae]